VHLPPRIQYHIFLICTLLYSTNCSFIFYTLQRVQLEVDFVINRGNLRYYIQSAFAINSEEKKEQERNSLKRIDDSFKKIIIVRDNIVPRYDEYGIYYVGIRDFLLRDDFLEA